MSPNKKNDYTLSLEGAAELIGKSVRTVQRYVKARRLSQQYVTGPKGEEARLSKAEVLQLEEKAQQFVLIEERAKSLAARHDELSQKDEEHRRTIAHLEHKVSRLERELERPLSAVERLTGKRQENH